MKNGIIVVFLPLLLAGCATNHLSQFYTDKTGGAPVPKELRKIVPEVRPCELGTEGKRLLESGMELLGYSDYWTSHPPSIADLKEHGKRVGASVVAFEISRRGSETKYQPIYNWVPGTTREYNSTGSAYAQSSTSLYGNGFYGYGQGNATASYSSTASESTPGRAEFAGVMPYTVHYYNVGAIFLRRSSEGSTAPVSNAAEKKQQANTGPLVSGEVKPMSPSAKKAVEYLGTCGNGFAEACNKVDAEELRTRGQLSAEQQTKLGEYLSNALRWATRYEEAMKDVGREMDDSLNAEPMPPDAASWWKNATSALKECTDSVRATEELWKQIGKEPTYDSRLRASEAWEKVIPAHDRFAELLSHPPKIN